MMKRVLYAAAHSGFNLGEVPLGGGASVCQHLVQEWERTKPFEWELLDPSLLGDQAPKHKDLVRFSESAYARFCYRFERVLTETILQHDPTSTVVLCNDISEGPDFKALSEKGFSICTIYHVDVVDYVARIYLRSWLKPETTTAFFRTVTAWGLGRFLPKMLRLVWAKQEASVRYSKSLIVPSQRMKDVLLRCYPETPPARIHVIPWGMWDEPFSADEVQREQQTIQNSFPVPAGAFRLLLLSRISPEKGQDRLLKALALWEGQPDFPKEGVALFLAGESAYMMGKKYEAELRRLAAKLKRCRVHFVGYAAGARKKAFFELSDLYVFPSRHESYGLTLLEALRAGKPVLATPSYGAQAVFKPAFGEMISSGSEAQVPERLVASLQKLYAERPRLKDMGAAARAWALQQPFSDSAERVAQLLQA